MRRADGRWERWLLTEAFRKLETRLVLGHAPREPHGHVAPDPRLLSLQNAYRELCRAYADHDGKPERRPTLAEFAASQQVSATTMKRRLRQLRASWQRDFIELPLQIDPI